jgi:2-polyprenyl-3-methyl-5-hydroxy-6-metoxy-1,4-benzoquinol methylase
MNPHLEEFTSPGLHAFLAGEVIPDATPGRTRAVDLGPGSGALAVRLRDKGYTTIAAGMDRNQFKADMEFKEIDLNLDDFVGALGPAGYDLVTAIEVIEHLENPIGFLRSVGRLLKPDGLAVVTTPNVDSVAARLRFVFTGTIRQLEAAGEPTHITPIFWDLLRRQWIPLAGLQLRGHWVFPVNGYSRMRPLNRWVFRVMDPLVKSEVSAGDNLVILVGRCVPREPLG